MSFLDQNSSPGQGFGQGSASITDLVTALQGVINQLSSSNTTFSSVLTALQDINFPQNTLGYTVSGLPTGSLGAMAYVTDGTGALAWGATVTGGGSTKYLVWFNGSNWTVVGK